MDLQRIFIFLIRIGKPFFHGNDRACLHKYRHLIQRRVHSHKLPALVFLVCPVMIPAVPCRQVACPHLLRFQLLVLLPIIHGLRHRADEQALPEHKFLIHVPRLGIRRIIEQEAAHHGSVIPVHVPGQRINIRHQIIPQPDVFLNGIVKRLALFPEVPDLPRGVGAVGTEHGEKCTHLQPSDVQLPISAVRHALVIVPLPEPFRRRVRIAAAAPVLPFAAHREKSPDVQRPIGISGQAHVQALCDLLFQGVPGRVGVAGPEHRAVFLSRRVPGAGQVQHTDVLRLLPLIFIDPLRVHQRKQVGLLGRQIFFMLISYQHVALPGLPLHGAAPVRAAERLRGIAPPGVKASVEQFLFRLLPVHFPGLLGKCVVSGIVVEQMSRLKKFRMILPSCIHVGPHRYHGMGVHAADLLHALLQISIPRLVHQLFAPVARIPGVPVLHHAVQRHAQLPVSPHHIGKFLCRIILLLGLDVAERPFRQHGRAPGEIADRADDLVGRLLCDKIIIHLGNGIEKQVGIVRAVVESHQAAAVEQHPVALVRQEHGHGNPHVVLVQVLVMSPVIVDPFLCLPQAIDPFLRLPPKMQPPLVSLVVRHLFQVLDKIALSVYSLYPVDDRRLVSSRITHNVDFFQLPSALLQEETASASPAVRQPRPDDPPVRLQDLRPHAACPDLKAILCFFYRIRHRGKRRPVNECRFRFRDRFLAEHAPEHLFFHRNQTQEKHFPCEFRIALCLYTFHNIIPSCS